jgi:hypothetical protein
MYLFVEVDVWVAVHDGLGVLGLRPGIDAGVILAGLLRLLLLLLDVSSLSLDVHHWHALRARALERAGLLRLRAFVVYDPYMPCGHCNRDILG